VGILYFVFVVFDGLTEVNFIKVIRLHCSSYIDFLFERNNKLVSYEIGANNFIAWPINQTVTFLTDYTIRDLVFLGFFQGQFYGVDLSS